MSGVQKKGVAIMAKGNEAKTNLMNKIVAALGENYIGEFEKKHYFWSTENGEQVQVAISMTCPKNPVAVVNTSPSDELNFEDDSSFELHPTKFEPAEITPEEKETVNDLLKKLGL